MWATKFHTHTKQANFSTVCELSRKHPSILHISRTGRVALCNMAASRKRPHCASVNSHTTVGLVSRQWDAVDWVCVLYDHRIHNDRASRSDNAPALSTALVQTFLAKHHYHSALSALLQPKLGSLQLLAFSKATINVEREEILSGQP